MGSFDKALAATLGIEGDYSNQPADPGGKTRYGITEAVARRHGWHGDMRELPLDLAKAIYKDDYWNTPQLPCEEISAWYEPAALELFDIAVNSGGKEAGLFFQRALNALNRRATLWEDVETDGNVGNRTLLAMGACTDPADKALLVKMLVVQRGDFYLDLVRDDEKNEDFIRGWFKRRVILPAGGP